VDLVGSQTQPQRSSAPLLIFLLLILLGLFVLLWPSLNVRINTGIQDRTEGQCLSAGQNFDRRQEAFTLAQTAEEQRRIKPFGGNYGLGSYTICYTDGSQKRVQSDLFKGYYTYGNLNQPPHATHSEQATYGWLQNQLSHLSIAQNKVTAIYAVIFSQVAVCPPCQKDMVSWQRTLRQTAGINELHLSIWDIRPGRGFDPATYPADTGTPITVDDLRQVPIRFAP